MIADARHRTASLRSPSLGVFDLGLIVRRLDYLLLLAVVTLVGYGLWAIGGITRFDVPGNPDYFVTRQTIAVALGGAAMVVAILIPPSVYQRHWRFLYGATIGVMLFVFVFAEAVRGSKRWIDLGPFQLQPSEFGKLFFVLAIAGFLVERGRRVGELGTVLTAIGLGLVPMGLVFLQPDLGTALVYGAAMAAVLFLAGVRWLHLVLLGVTALVLISSVLWALPAAGIEVLKPYQTARLTGFTNPDSDPGGLTYNVTQSITAVGAGGLSGPRRRGREPDAARLPPRARDRLRVRLVRRAARLLRHVDPAAALPARRVARPARRHRRRRPLRRGRRGRDRVRVPLPGVRQRRDDDGRRTDDGIPLPFVTVGGSSMVANLLAVGVLQAIHARGRLAGIR